MYKNHIAGMIAFQVQEDEPDKVDTIIVTTNNGNRYEVTETRNGSLSLHSIGASREKQEKTF